ncbi:hypothetical protein GGR55DRAFT_642930 [Xylaria sp. FL0064]|nr:hypothetical protein GGR55DRAFT_642930 [Xylaria sp. FL0064]
MEPNIHPASTMSSISLQVTIMAVFFIVGLYWFRNFFCRTNMPKPSNQNETQFRKHGSEVTLKELKHLYYELQSLERHKDILPHARDTLLLLLSESLESLSARLSTASGILSIASYDRDKLPVFVRSEQDGTTKFWEQYVQRRTTGHPRELFRSREDAAEWIKQSSSLRYVDGAWLGHLNKASTPFALRMFTKNASQVLFEEYGDGDLGKHHVHLYRQLVRDVSPDLPAGDSEDFIHPRHSLDDIHIWKTAVAQLLISLLPQEFFPEILGFNLHFERVSKDTLLASREVRELGFDPYYFLLHISIDNSDSGHTAMALQVIVDYMEHLISTEDSNAVQRAWRGVQAGFILSQNLTSRTSKLPQDYSQTCIIPQSKSEVALGKILLSKSVASHRIHCNVGMKVGFQTLSQWLDPKAITSHLWRLDFIHHLNLSKHLVRRGNSGKSNIIRALSWGGKMFGAFTEGEVKVVSDWIDSLPSLDQVYWRFTGRTPTNSTDMLTDRDIVADYPVFPVHTSTIPRSTRAAYSTADIPDLARQAKIQLEHKMQIGKMDLTKLLPLWFAHTALLEGFVSIPSKTASVFGCAIIRFIRAQNGFSVEGLGVQGKDSFLQALIGIYEIGLEMAKGQGLEEPTSLRDILRKWPSSFAIDLLELSMYPEAKTATLLGLERAFVVLHDVVALSPWLLSDVSKSILSEIAKRETNSLMICLEELDREGLCNMDFVDGFHHRAAAIRDCFV